MPVRILDEWAAYARAKRRPQGCTISEGEIFCAEFARSHAALRSAVAYLRSTYAQLFAEAELGTPSPECVLDSRLCASNMISAETQLAQAASIRHQQAWRRRPDEVRGTRPDREQYPGERDLPGHDRHADDDAAA